MSPGSNRPHLCAGLPEISGNGRVKSYCCQYSVESFIMI